MDAGWRPAMPPVDRDDSEKQRKAQAHSAFSSVSWTDAPILGPELRQLIQTTIRCLLHGLLSGIQEWMIAVG
jgi:hypothetical protein